MPEKITNKALIILAYSSLFILGFLDNLRSPYFSSLLKDIQLNDVQGAFFFITPSSFAFLGSLLIIHFTKRWSTYTNLLVMTLLLCIGFSLISLTTSFWSLVGFCAIYGLGAGFSNVVQNIGVHEGCSPANSRRLFGGLQSMYALASFSAPFLAGWMFELGVSWQSSFQMAALGCAILVTTLFLFGHSSAKSRHRIVEQIQSRTAAPSKKELWIVTAPIAFYLIGEMSISTRLALYLERDLGYTKESASYWLAAFFAFFTVGRLCCWILDTSKWSQPQMLKWCSGLGGVFYTLGLLVHPIFFVFSGLCMAAFYPTAMDWIGDVYREHVNKALSIGIASGYLVVVLMNFVLGQLSENFGLKNALWLGPVGLFTTVLSLKLSLRTLSRK